MNADIKTGFIFSLILFFIPIFLEAQEVHPLEKFKPPLVTAVIDAKSDSSKVTKEEAARLVGLPLKVVDNAGKEYAIATYMFLYKRKDLIEDPETGNVSVGYSITSQRFSETPLPKVWIENLSRELQAEEEFLFFDILAKDDKGRNFYAPQLRIIVVQ